VTDLANCIAPRWTPAPRRRRKQQVPEHAQLEVHGAGFAGAMAELVCEFGKGAIYDELRDAYAHFGVPAMTPTEYRAAVAASVGAEQDLAAFHLEFEDYFRTRLKPRGSTTGRIPHVYWGVTFYLMRRDSRLGMDHLARTVSQVERCTRNDVKTIESAEVPPEDIRLRRIALCMAVALDLDPIYMRYQMGLVRWGCEIELEELESINPHWVELVETMNQQAAERPPKWTVEGER
jgi:hypothetical protein